MELWQLRQKQSLDLELKEKITKKRIIDWYNYYNGMVYIAFSGGKDSTVLLHIVRKIYPEITAVFCNTGLEHPEIINFVKSVHNVTWIKPKIPFRDVILKYGYPVGTKKVARFIRDLQNRSDKNQATVKLRLTGYNRNGVYCSSQKIPKKWKIFVDSGIKVSEQCCDIMKKEPFKRYQKLTGNFPIIGTLACESGLREKQYLKNGCNAFNLKNPASTPLSFWKTEDIYQYIKKYNLEISKAYETESNTGCMFCMFGVHLEKKPNRFQRMKVNHPKYYDYCINKLGCGKILDIIGVEY